MPTLHWIGKDKVINHHLDVPYKVLEHQYRFGSPSVSEFGKVGFEDSQDLEAAEIQSSANPKNPNSDHLHPNNKIIHGDNLEALKSLLPEYEGKIKCIYIDPPYNTGNESWVYNDNVNDPKIKKWLGNVVGKEAEDLTRHDKWLCMMYPRLKLLHKLLADDGAIFISIDDNEQANLKLMMDEIFGGGNFVANFIWNHRKSSQNDTDVSLSHNYTFCYSKNRRFFRVRSLPIVTSKFTNSDNDVRGPWVADPMDAPNIRSNLEYEIINPNTKEIFLPSKGRHWRFTKEKYEEALKDGRILFGKTGKSKPQYKRFMSEAEAKGTNPFTIWAELATATDATKELMQIFDGTRLFDTPKPTSLIEKILQISTDKNSIILDSFAGSGTTAHAVLNLNKQDGGNRKFILIEMETYAETITAERVKRVMNGYGNTEGTGGSFDFYMLGEPLFLEDGLLNENLPLQKIREYIWYTETASPQPSPKEREQAAIMFSATAPSPLERAGGEAAFLGTNQNTAYYFYYHPQEITTLDHDFLAAIQTKAEQYIIYADNCLLTPNYMAKNSIVFKKIPRDITKF